jgi:curved DNA-binding protein CbpA
MEKEHSVAPDKDRLPRLVDGLDLKALPIGPAEAFVLSRIDGASSELEIASGTNMSLSDVQRVLDALAELGAVHFVTRSGGEKRVVRAERSRSGEFRLGSVSVVEDRRGASQHPGAKLYDAAELDEAADIDVDRKRAILDTFYKLDQLTYYELLGADPSADKRVIKAKYYEVVNRFHPDRYYGKKLGSFKAKLERVFQQITEAHEVLTRAEARAEYDAYLNAERRTKALDHKLHDEEAYARELLEVQARIEAEVQADSPLLPPEALENTAIRPSSNANTKVSSPPAPSAPARREPSRSEMPKGDPDARRRALARKLGVSIPPPAAPRPPLETNPALQQRAVEDLKRRYDARMTEARRRQVGDYQERAEEAIQSGNLVDAVNALRIASSLDPEHAALRTKLVELEREAARELSNRYLEQATYEERERRFADAARSYSRALAGKPNPKLQERLAFCLLSSGGDVRRALENARAAVLAMPEDAKCRVTLARAYLAAKMRESALGELDRAGALAPSDDSIKDLIRRVRRGEL